jgi:hypothetical protein
MNSDERLKLHELIKEGNVHDNTNNIRKLQHSKQLKKDVMTIKMILSRAECLEYEKLNESCGPHCSFMIEHYKNIYQRILKGQVDFSILDKFLDCLESIENGTRDQHEASYEIGTLLKSLYIDTKIYDAPERRGGIDIDWNEYKNKIVK